MFTTRDHALALIRRRPIVTLPLSTVSSSCGICGHPLVAKSREALAQARTDHRAAVLELEEVVGGPHLMLQQEAP